MMWGSACTRSASASPGRRTWRPRATWPRSWARSTTSTRSPWMRASTRCMTSSTTLSRSSRRAPPALVRSITLTLGILPSPTSLTSLTLVLRADQLPCICASWVNLLGWVRLCVAEAWHVGAQVRSAVPMYLLSRKIKAEGFKVVLSGEGADEVYGGYLFFHKAPSPRHFHECAPQAGTRKQNSFWPPAVQ